uniref:F-box domain-containing protein n=1 Tax=Meloidogyne incognita TaxID=6306 RepID=A0A914LMN5_MELIC
MSLPSNSVGNCNDLEQDLSDGWSRVGDEDQSTILTDDISQELDCSEEGDKNDRKTIATVNSSLVKNWITTILRESNSGEQNVVEQDLNACSKDGNEDKSTTLTDDITQTLDWTDKEYKDKLKMRATINSTLTKKWIKKIPTKIKINLSAQEKLDVFKYLNFSQLISFQKTNYYFNNFINSYKNELARDYFNIKIVGDRRFFKF